jgi:rare lipoprotein A (peptidoglycan hydrolase)
LSLAKFFNIVKDFLFYPIKSIFIGLICTFSYMSIFPKYSLFVFFCLFVIQLQAQQNDSFNDTTLVTFKELNYKLLGPVKKGMASYYSLKFEGRKTATGAIFSHAKYTAASNNFPLGVYVRVTNPKNNQFVIVKINDRMGKSMSKKGRIVDLTRLAAKEIGIFKQGIGKVLVQKVEKSANK